VLGGIVDMINGQSIPNGMSALIDLMRENLSPSKQRRRR